MARGRKRPSRNLFMALMWSKSKTGTPYRRRPKPRDQGLEPMRKNELETHAAPLHTLLFMPSFYGALTWGFWLILYFARFMDWNDDQPLSIVIFFLVELAFIASIFVYSRYYRSWIGTHMGALRMGEGTGQGLTGFYKAFIAALHVVGFYATIQYMREFGSVAGGLSGFKYLVDTQPWYVRNEGEYTRSLGTQLGYFGWIAIGLTIFWVVRKQLPRWWLIPAGAQFAANLLWLGRMRPTMVVFYSVLMALVASPKPHFRNVLKGGLVVVLGIVVLFWSIALWIDKLPELTGFVAQDLRPFFQNFYFYGCGGFAYLNHILTHGVRVSFPPENTFYPLFKVLATLKAVSEPPSQIKPFLFLPFSTNVSTFLDPFYRDGGMPLLFIGILIQTFGMDAFGLYLLRLKRPLAYFAWTSLCYTSFMAFFTFKICEVPTWLFVVLGLASAWLVRPPRTAAQAVAGARSARRALLPRGAAFRRALPPASG